MRKIIDYEELKTIDVRESVFVNKIKEEIKNEKR